MHRFFNLANRLVKKVTHSSKMISYAQCGEDLIVNHLLGLLRIPEPIYLDIGAHHPTYLSNTYFFYRKGCQGVCVEPDPRLFRRLSRGRKRDTCLNVGVGTEAIAEDAMDFFIMSTPTLNTFSKTEALRYQSYGKQKIKQTVRIPLVPINDILKKYFTAAPNFVSLDVEGLDLPIVQSIDFSQFRSEVFCIETLSYTEDRTEEKINDIIEFMIAQNYVVYADTYINTIFVEQQSWINAHNWKKR